MQSKLHHMYSEGGHKLNSSNADSYSNPLRLKSILVTTQGSYLLLQYLSSAFRSFLEQLMVLLSTKKVAPTLDLRLTNCIPSAVSD